MQIRPFIEMRVGQINLPLRVPISPLLIDAPNTTLSSNIALGASSLTVSSTAGFFAGAPVLIGEPGNQNSEIVTVSAIPDINTLSLSGATLLPHSASTSIYELLFSNVILYNAATLNGTKNPIANLTIGPGVTTDFNDIASTGGFYFAQYFQDYFGNVAAATPNNNGATYAQNNIANIDGGNGQATVLITSVDGGGAVTGVTLLSAGNGYTNGTYNLINAGDGSATVDVVVEFFSPYSDPAPYEGYTLRSARSIIDSALQEINKEESQTLTDEFAFNQLDSCQTEVIQDLKRWSFMQKFDAIVGNVTTGSWKFTLPDDIGVDYSNKSIYNARIGTQQRLVWVDKQKFDEFLVGVGYSTLAVAAVNSDTTLTLSDSADFDATGMVTIGANTYSYTANDTTTGILTLAAAITPATVAPIDADVFQGATSGLPQYITYYDNKGFYWPITSATYNGRNIYMDYYVKQTKITSDSDLLMFPDATVAIAYLCWKFLKKLSSGGETPESTAYMNQYLARKEKMRQKEVMNRTFKLRPRVQNFAVQSEFSESTPRWVRDAEFPNTGF